MGWVPRTKKPAPFRHDRLQRHTQATPDIGHGQVLDRYSWLIPLAVIATVVAALGFPVASLAIGRWWLFGLGVGPTGTLAWFSLQMIEACDRPSDRTGSSDR
jgi:hypothetical protein